MRIPTVQLGKPDMIDKFDLYNIDGINVFVRKGIQADNNEIRVYIKKFLWAKDLDVSGIRINY